MPFKFVYYFDTLYSFVFYYYRLFIISDMLKEGVLNSNKVRPIRIFYQFICQNQGITYTYTRYKVDS